MKFTIERLDEKPITNEIVKAGYFVSVFKNNECVGTCLTDGSMTAKECYLNVLNNRAIDDLERIEDERINNSLDY